MIITRRLILRPWKESDADALFKYASEPKVSMLALWPAHTSVEMSRWVINNVFKPNKDTFAIVLKQTQETIGCIGLVPRGSEHYNVENGERELGYWIGLPYWGQGMTTEALLALMDYLSAQGEIKSLLITTDATNRASQRVAEKCGFVLTDSYNNDRIPSLAFHAKLPVEDKH